MNKISLILGGAKSGKSNFAENQALPYSHKIYIATAEARDEEMKRRIKSHQTQRDENWQTIEQPLDLTTELNKPYPENTVILIDCMTMWLSNLFEQKPGILKPSTPIFCLEALPNCSADVILVSNEAWSFHRPRKCLSPQISR